jgi:prophage antirepressor-like protein
MAMTQTLSIFKFKEHPVRIIKDGQGNPWWVANEIGAIIGLTDTRKSVNSLGNDERNIIPVTDAQGKEQQTFVINEPGLYRLLMRSRKQEAKEFQHWIAHEVLPSIRRTGAYGEPWSVLQAVMNTADALLKMTEYLGGVEKRLASIEQRPTAPTLLPPPVREVPVRGRINQIIRDFVRRHSGSYEDTWNDLYREFYYRYHIDLKTKAAHRPGWSPLDIAADGECINELFNLAAAMYAGK